MRTYRTFDTWQEAAQYRAINGTGGFIFVPVANHALVSESILFPVGMTASKVMLHQLTKGLSGELI